MFITLLVTVLFFLMWVFPSSLWFSISLILIVLSLLSWLSVTNFVSSLIVYIFLLVYLGAVIVVIGYICAVVPNPKFSSSTNYSSLILIVSMSVFFLSVDSGYSIVNPYLCEVDTLKVIFNVDLVFMFFILAVILFFVLLIVTTQYLAPNGPFRSVG